MFSRSHEVTSQSRKNERVHETYKYVIGELIREDAVRLTVPPERLSCKSCLKVSQLLACTIPTLPGLVLVSRYLSACNSPWLTFTPALITLWVFSLEFTGGVAL